MFTRKTLVLSWAALLTAVSINEAAAHAFTSGESYYKNFLEGIYVILAYPGVLLPIVAVGILVGLWDKNGVTRALPAFAIGSVAGLPASVLVGPQIAIWLMALGIVSAALAALLSRHSTIVNLVLSFVTGLMAIMTSLEGHGLFELQIFIYVGIFVAAIYVFVALAGTTRLVLDKFPKAATAIAFRVAASWIGAILLLFLAFEIRG